MQTPITILEAMQLLHSCLIVLSNSILAPRTFVLLDGEHGQSVDDLVGGQRSTEGRAEDVLKRDFKK